MGEYLGNMIEYLNNNSNSVVFKHLDDFIALLDGMLTRLFDFFIRLKERILKINE